MQIIKKTLLKLCQINQIKEQTYTYTTAIIIVNKYVQKSQMLTIKVNFANKRKWNKKKRNKKIINKYILKIKNTHIYKELSNLKTVAPI